MRPCDGARRLAAAGGCLALLGLAACDSGPATVPAGRTPPPAAAPERNLAQGTGEPRQPEPFTIHQRLLDAVQRGDRAMIATALAHGATVADKDDLGRSVVLLATLDAGDLDLVRWLHEQGAALDEPDAGGRTALSFAAQEGRLALARYLVDHGAAVDRPDMQRRTPLFHAALGDHADVAALLVDRGASPNVHDQFGDTPLMVACAKGHVAAATLLLQRGADPAAKDQEGRTARDRSADTAAAVCRPAGPS